MAAHRTDYIRDQQRDLETRGLSRTLPLLAGKQNPRCVIAGKQVINLASNNYLGLANHPRVEEAAIRAIRQYGVGVAAARVVCGNLPIHEELERWLADFKRTESALVFQTGYAANAGLISALLTDDDTVVSDELNHASIIDGCRMSRAKVRVYRHGDPSSADEELRKARQDGAMRLLLVTDGVFSMDGDIAPLSDLLAAADRHDAMTMVDEAHAVGVLGEGGRGTVSHFGLEGRVEIQMGTLSKALGVVGGYVVGPEHLRAWLINRHRPFLFSASTHTPADVAACIAALQVLQEEPDRIRRLWDNSRHFHDGLAKMGFDTGRSQTPITPVIVHDDIKAQQLSRMLYQRGVYASPMVYPVVAQGQARLRTIVTSEHSRADLEEALVAFKTAAQELRVLP